MRYPADHKESVRAGIVEAASRALRAGGLAGISIPALMKRAGLTHGGFYVHFASRDELVAAAVSSGADETAERVLGDSAGSLDDTLKRYLSLEHVKHPAFGCVLAALGAEGRHQPSVVRKAFKRAATGFIALVDRKLHPRRTGGPATDDALALAATMIGAVVLARLVDDDALAGRILDAARRR